ncbi:MAG TPA: hypothetical protein VE987_15740 [Polyangiaceae bacterium]|nr:hypothetical protein [Polyangiaceae bacterium]
MSLTIDPRRYAEQEPNTGILVRAEWPGGAQFMNADIAWLTRDSVLEWLRDRDERFLKSTILLLLGHEHTVVP